MKFEKQPLKCNFCFRYFSCRNDSYKLFTISGLLPTGKAKPKEPAKVRLKGIVKQKSSIGSCCLQKLKRFLGFNSLTLRKDHNQLRMAKDYFKNFQYPTCRIHNKKKLYLCDSKSCLLRMKVDCSECLKTFHKKTCEIFHHKIYFGVDVLVNFKKHITAWKQLQFRCSQLGLAMENAQFMALYLSRVCSELVSISYDNYNLLFDRVYFGKINEFGAMSISHRHLERLGPLFRKVERILDKHQSSHLFLANNVLQHTFKFIKKPLVLRALNGSKQLPPSVHQAPEAQTVTTKRKTPLPVSSLCPQKTTDSRAAKHLKEVVKLSYSNRPNHAFQSSLFTANTLQSISNAFPEFRKFFICYQSDREHLDLADFHERIKEDRPYFIVIESLTHLFVFFAAFRMSSGRNPSQLSIVLHFDFGDNFFFEVNTSTMLKMKNKSFITLSDIQGFTKTLQFEITTQAVRKDEVVLVSKEYIQRQVDVYEGLSINNEMISIIKMELYSSNQSQLSFVGD